MRDVLILGIILGSLPLCFFRPYFGVLMWTWIAYFNPHRLAYPRRLIVHLLLILGDNPFSFQPGGRYLT